jgi:hypothetical protein
MAGSTPNLAQIVGLTGDMFGQNINRIGRGIGARVAHIPGNVSGAVGAGVDAAARGARAAGRGAREVGRGVQLGAQAFGNAAVNGARATGRGIRTAAPYAMKYGLPTAAGIGTGYVMGNNNQE